MAQRLPRKFNYQVCLSILKILSAMGSAGPPHAEGKAQYHRRVTGLTGAYFVVTHGKPDSAD